MTIKTGHRLLRLVLLLVGAAHLLAFLIVALSRIRFPFELEWAEGVILDHVHRVLSGQQVYVAPSLDFVAMIYTPGYYYLSALVALMVGEGFVALRLVSLLATLVTLWLVFALVRRETGDSYAASLGALLYAATFHATGGFFDVGRPDALFLALLLASILVLRSASSLRGFAVAGLLLAAAGLTKQTALLLGAPLLLYACYVSPAGAAAFAAACAGSVLAVGSALEWRSAGWFSHYIAAAPGVDRFQFWLDEILLPVPVACLGAAWLMCRGPKAFADRRGYVFYALTAVGLIGGSWYVSIQRNTAPNALMPAFACLAIFFGIFLHDAIRRLDVTGAGRAAVFVCLAGLAQFAILAYDPRLQIPTAADERGGRRLVEAIAKMDGPVLVYDRGYLARLAGKPGHATRIPIDALQGVDASRFSAQLDDAVRQGRYAAVILSALDRFTPALACRYLPAVPILPEAAAPRTVVYREPSPNLLYRRRPLDDPAGSQPCGR